VPAGDLAAVWIYLVGPTVGAVVGWAGYRFLRGGPPTES
jgi:hypothetical protein